MKHPLLSLLWLLCPAVVAAQPLQSPEAFLGYPLGSRFSAHHRVVDYFEHVAAHAPRVQLVPYGSTYEGRPLLVAIVSSERNLARLEEIRHNQQRMAGFEPGNIAGDLVPVVWLSYNIHGNEASSTEAALHTLYTLAVGDTARWLDDLVVIIDPCLNPDGRERYVNGYQQTYTGAVHRDASEHHEAWPGGRFNHYLFDLNRDWCWQTQQESRQRVQLFHQWMPQVHVDFHEMGPSSSYFFGPAAQPLHELVQPWQIQFQEWVAENHAAHFDQRGWPYFTREVFDLLYPSYGDSWPTFQGSVGFTYEQGGSGRAGIALLRAGGDTLTLRHRMLGHVVTGLSTIEVAHRHRDYLLDHFRTYFRRAQSDPPGAYRGYVIRQDNPDGSLRALCRLLDRNRIRYEQVGSARTLAAFAYQTGRDTSIRVQPGDLLVPVAQPQAHLVQVLFDPDPALSDSITYDLTAWGLPYVFGLEAYATREALRGQPVADPPSAQPGPMPYAYLLPWRDADDVRTLGAWVQAGLQVRYATSPFEIGGRAFGRGTLLLFRHENRRLPFDSLVQACAQAQQQVLVPVQTGLAAGGADLGSDAFERVVRPEVALLIGEEADATSAGELWHFFEEQLQYPLTLIHTRYLGRVDLARYDVVLLPEGDFGDWAEDLLAYARQGGRVVALGSAVSAFARQPAGADALSPLLATVRASGSGMSGRWQDSPAVPYENRGRDGMSDDVAGAIYAIRLDPTHPLAYGEDAVIHLVKRTAEVYPSLPSGGWSVGTVASGTPVAGFAGMRLQNRLRGSLSVGIESYGQGSLVYFVDAPLLRGFWYSGGLLLGNAVFFRE
ncbi:MAG: M14 family metallopeptidase [Bacteroidia bacterium]